MNPRDPHQTQPISPPQLGNDAVAQSPAQPAPPLLNPSANRGVFSAGAILVALTLLAGAWVLHRFDPARHSFYPQCRFHATTGMQCPGCGGLRALHALAHGHVAEAFRLNPLFIATIPLALVLVGRWLWRRRREPGLPFVVPTRWLWWGMAALLGFGIVRNLPGVWPAWFNP